MFELIITLLTLVFSLAISYVSSPVHSVLFLVATFFVSSISLLSIGIEFLSLRFRVVYIGAIAVLFLFVVIMIDLKEVERNDPRVSSSSFVTLLFFIPSFRFILSHLTSKNLETTIAININSISSVGLIGQLLYTKLWEFYLIAGFILLVSLIGAVVLTVPRPYKLISTKEDLSRQLARNPSDAIFTVVKQ
jgi:NADH-quinone oxidoreductase subunit J